MMGGARGHQAVQFQVLPKHLSVPGPLHTMVLGTSGVQKPPTILSSHSVQGVHSHRKRHQPL